MGEKRKAGLGTEGEGGCCSLRSRDAQEREGKGSVGTDTALYAPPPSTLRQGGRGVIRGADQNGGWADRGGCERGTSRGCMDACGGEEGGGAEPGCGVLNEAFSSPSERRASLFSAVCGCSPSRNGGPRLAAATRGAGPLPR